MGIRRALSGNHLSWNRQSKQAPQPARAEKPHPRSVDLIADRESPAVAGAARALPTKKGFRLRWVTVLAYGFILVATLTIATIGYSTYAFSRYQGLILPGVYVDTVPIGGNTPLQAVNIINDRLGDIGFVPIEFTYGGHVFVPTPKELDLTYAPIKTVNQAYSIGRTGNFLQNLVDRFPVKRHFSITLQHKNLNKSVINLWIVSHLAHPTYRQMVDARLVVSGGSVVALPSQTGYRLNAGEAYEEVQRAVGKLERQRIQIPVIPTAPQITNSRALATAARVNAFLRQPPVLFVGQTKLTLDSSDLAQMISFKNQTDTGSIKLIIDKSELQSYIDTIASNFAADNPAISPKYSFANGAVRVLATRRIGRTLNSGLAFRKVRNAMKTMTPAVGIIVPVTKVVPPRDTSNPATLGVTTLLGAGSTSSAGDGSERLIQIQQIAASLNDQVISPGASISFNDLVGTDWPANAYNDRGHMVNGSLESGSGGAIQQVATTFYRAGFNAGLPIVEREPHTYNLPWYDPPTGTDATVTMYGSDVSFRNTTGGYVYLQSAENPVTGVLHVYFYGRNTGWRVYVSAPLIKSVTPAGATVMTPDPSLLKGKTKYARFAHRGEVIVVTRTVRKPGRSEAGAIIDIDKVKTTYLASHAIILVGTKLPATPTPTPLPPTPTPTPTPTPSPTPQPTPTPTAPPVVTITPLPTK